MRTYIYTIYSFIRVLLPPTKFVIQVVELCQGRIFPIFNDNVIAIFLISIRRRLSSPRLFISVFYDYVDR